MPGEEIINQARNAEARTSLPVRANLGLAAKPEDRVNRELTFTSTEKRIPVNFHITSTQGKTISATKETLTIDNLEPGWFYIITSISARQETAGTPSIEIAIKQSFDEIVLERGVVGNADDTINAVGEFNIDDSDKIVANFYGANTSNKLHLYVHGYRIKKSYEK